MTNNMKNNFFVCSCSSLSHMFVFTKHEPYRNDPPEMFLQVHLVPTNLFDRIKRAFKYIFNMSCNYGDWAEVIIEKKQAEEIKSVMTEFVNDVDDWERKNLKR